jgi:hypothetical protein
VDAAPDREGVVEQVDVLPLKGEGLGLAQAQSQRDRPAGRVPDGRSRFEDGAGLGEVEGGGQVAGPLGWWVDQGGDVARDVAALASGRPSRETHGSRWASRHPAEMVSTLDHPLCFRPAGGAASRTASLTVRQRRSGCR